MSETTLFPENFYPVTYCAIAGRNMGIMVQQNFSPYHFMDWSAAGFSNAPAQIIQPLFPYTTPIIAGNVQRYGFVIGVKAFLDGYYNVYYTSNGTLLEGVIPDWFLVTSGSANTYPKFALVAS
jgi:hypothetical protein